MEKSLDQESREAKPIKRQGFWYLVRRVPLEFQPYDKREMVTHSTGIRVSDDPRAIRARQQVAKLDAALRVFWSELRDGRDPDAKAKYARLVAEARRRGFEYLHRDVLLHSEVEQLVRRLFQLKEFVGEKFKTVGPALMGELAEPAQPECSLRLSGLVDETMEIRATEMARKSPEQVKRWRIPRDNVVEVFTAVVGRDKAVQDLTRADAQALRKSLQNRIAKGELQVDTANTCMGRLRGMINAVNDYHQLGLEDVFEKLFIGGGEQKRRPAFSIGWVRDVVLASGALGGLNEEARAIVYVVMETGMRPMEVCGLTERSIFLDDEVPHVSVVPGVQDTKTLQSVRDVPLVGIALSAMRRFPKGFPTYRGKSDVLSAVVSKYMRENGLFEKSGQTFYSLRHTFKDRLRDVNASDDLMKKLMGHKHHYDLAGRARKEADYGDGYSLAKKREWLEKIAFKVEANFERRGRGPSKSGHRASTRK